MIGLLFCGLVLYLIARSGKPYEWEHRRGRYQEEEER